MVLLSLSPRASTTGVHSYERPLLAILWVQLRFKSHTEWISLENTFCVSLLAYSCVGITVAGASGPQEHRESTEIHEGVV